MIKIMFVCHGNICRSPMAEFYMKHIVKREGLQDLIQVDSTATSREEIGNDTHYGTRAVLDRHSIAYSPRRARQLTKDDYEQSDLVLLMDKNNQRNIRYIIPDDYDEKIHLLLEFAGENASIADPWYTGEFDTTYRDVTRGCNALLEYIKENLI